MKQNVIEAGRRVADKLKPAEEAIDDAMLAWSGVIVAVIASRREAGQAHYVAQKLLDRTIATLGALNETRVNAVKVHSEVARVKSELGLDPVDYGCTSYCLPSDATGHSLAPVQAA